LLTAHQPFIFKSLNQSRSFCGFEDPGLSLPADRLRAMKPWEPTALRKVLSNHLAAHHRQPSGNEYLQSEDDARAKKSSKKILRIA
jgi:hypothetical protein